MHEPTSLSETERRLQQVEEERKRHERDKEEAYISKQRRIREIDAKIDAEIQSRIENEVLPKFPIYIKEGKQLSLERLPEDNWEFLIDGKKITPNDITLDKLHGDERVYGIPFFLLNHNHSSDLLHLFSFQTPIFTT